MITVCPICGKSVVAHWPEFWPYRRSETYYCSQNCYDVSLTKDLNMLHDAARRRRETKMARMKKDGTPAKRPGPKAKTIIETPEGGSMEVEIPEKVPTVKVDGPLKIETPEAGTITVNGKPPFTPTKAYKVTGIRTEQFGEFYFDKKFNSIDWRTEEGDEIGMSPQGWKNLAEELPDILHALGVDM